jgi:hypothetical protein
MDKEIPVIECVTETIITNKKTGKVYKDEEEVKLDLTASPEDITRDTKVTVTNKGLEVFNKVMNQK